MGELITANNGLLPEADKQIAELESLIKKLKEQEEKIKELILQEMEAKGIIKVDTEHLTITYIAETDRETFDTKTFRKDEPEMYDMYVKISKVKPQIRVKLK